MTMCVVSSLSCFLVPLLVVWLAAVSSQLEQHEEEGAGWEVREQGSGQTEDLLEPDEEEVNYYTANINDFFEGDILLTPTQWKELKEGIIMEKEEEEVLEAEDKERDNKHDIHARAVVRHSTYKWPNAVIPYVLSSSLSSTHVEAIQSAMRTYQSETCVRFVPWSGQSSYVRFIRGRGCYSYIGRVGGAQDISIGDGCHYKGIVMHEIFHALGRWHEHSRPDRDSYISVNYNNIRDGVENQFFKLRSSYASTNGIAYDYSSVMHYSAYAFSSNREPTIVPRDSRVSLGTLGQRRGLSSRDYQHIANLYCNQVSAPQWSSWGNWGQCSASCGSGTQTRTRSCQGSGCSGSDTESRSCSDAACPGQWNNWSSWGACSPTCGTNRVRSRSRSCQAQGGCVGESSQSASCADAPCSLQRPQAGMSEWSSWGLCSSVCGGYQMRKRTCLSASRGCSSPYYQLRRCTVGSCSSFRLDEQQQNPQQHELEQDDTDTAKTEPISAASGLTVPLLLNCAIIAVATLMNS